MAASSSAALFAGVRFYVETASGASELIKELKRRGGDRQYALDSFVTHVISDDKDILELAQATGVPVVTPNWVWLSIHCNRLMRLEDMLLAKAIFSGMVVFLAEDVKESEVATLWTLLALRGGRSSASLTSECTHVLTRTQELSQAGPDDSAPIMVDPEWLRASFKASQLLPVQEYSMNAKQASQKETATTETKVATTVSGTTTTLTIVTTTTIVSENAPSSSSSSMTMLPSTPPAPPTPTSLSSPASSAALRLSSHAPAAAAAHNHHTPRVVPAAMTPPATSSLQQHPSGAVGQVKSEIPTGLRPAGITVCSPKKESVAEFRKPKPAHNTVSAAVSSAARSPTTAAAASAASARSPTASVLDSEQPVRRLAPLPSAAVHLVAAPVVLAAMSGVIPAQIVTPLPATHAAAAAAAAPKAQPPYVPATVQNPAHSTASPAASSAATTPTAALSSGTASPSEGSSKKTLRGLRIAIDLEDEPDWDIYKVFARECTGLLESMGARVRTYWTRDCNVVVTPYQTTQSYKQAKACNQLTVSMFWLRDVIDEGNEIRQSHVLHFPLRSNMPLPQWVDKEITVTNISGAARERTKSMIKAIGAKFTGYMTRHHTLLISASATGEKYDRALEWGVPIVSPRWLEDTVREWFSQPLEHYTLDSNVNKQEDVQVSPEKKRRRISKTYNVAFTLLNWEERDALTSILASFNMKLTDASEADILVTAGVCRTEKFLMALLLKKTIASPQWLHESKKVGAVLDPTDFPVADPDSEGMLNMSLSLSQARARQRSTPLFNRMTFFITPGVSPPWEILQTLVEAGGGRVSTHLEDFLSDADSEYFKVVSCSEDADKLNILPKGTPIYNADLILLAALHQQLNPDENILHVR